LNSTEDGDSTVDRLNEISTSIKFSGDNSIPR